MEQKREARGRECTHNIPTVIELPKRRRPRQVGAKMRSNIKRGDKRGDSVKRETAWGTWDLRSHRGAVGLKAREMHSTRRTIKPVSVTSDLRDQLTAICRKAKEKEICCSDEIRDRSMRPERRAYGLWSDRKNGRRGLLSPVASMR